MDSASGSVKQRLKEIALVIYNSPGMKVADLIAQFEISERTIKEALRSLIEAGLVEYIGSKKAGSYRLTKKMRDKLH